MARWLKCALSVVAMVACLTGWMETPGWAKGTLKADDVLVLLQVGYQEAQIIAQIDKAGMRGKFGLTPAQVLKLRKAGASFKLLRTMGIQGLKKTPAKAQPAPVTLAELKGWLAQKKGTPWIRSQLKRRGVKKSDFGPFAILALNRAGLPLELLQLVVSLKQRKAGQAPATRRVAPRPVQPRKARPVPLRPLPRLVPTKPRLVPPTTPRPIQPTQRPLARPAPTRRAQPPTQLSSLPPLSEDTKQALKAREKQVQRRKARLIKRPKDGIYRHIGRHYKLPIPKGWYVYEDVHPDTGLMALYLTPEANDRPFFMKRGIWLILEYLPHDDRFTLSRKLTQMGQYLLRTLLAREPGLKVTNKLAASKWHKQNSVTAVLQGKTITNAKPIRLSLRIMRHHKAVLYTGVFASPSKHAAFRTQADAVLNKLTLQNPHTFRRGQRLAKEQSVQAAIGKSTKGVVSISLGVRRKGKLTFRAAGSGFVVTSDGYVLTNWHVAVNMRTNKPYEQYVLNWDQTTNQPSVKAKFVGAHYQWPSWKKVRLVDPKTGRISVRFQRRHVDIALLKIVKKGTYPTVKLSAIRHAMLGDSVIALGFPLEGKGIQDIGNETITATTGRISRMVRMSNKQVNEIQHTAKVAGGNSGGPLLDTATGAVIGINTWVGTFDKRLRRPGMGLGYYYALPIDLGWIYFPDYLEYSGQTLTATDWLDLGSKWFAAGQIKAAARAFKRAIKIQPGLTAGYMKLAQLHIKRADQHKDDSYQKHLNAARRWADRGLKRSTYHAGLMRTLAQISMRQQQWRTAAFLLQQALAARPDDWSLYVLRGLFYTLQKKHELALQDASRVIQRVGRVLPQGHLLKGHILYNAKRYFEGQRAYRQALKSAPQNLQALLGEAKGYSFLKQHADAIQHFQAIDRKHRYEPAVFKAWMMALIRSDVAQKKQKAWGIFQKLMQSTQLRGTQMDTISLYFGGALAADVLNAKYRQRVMWGIWGELLAKHTKSPITGQAGLRLTAISLRQNSPGLAYAIFRILSPQLFRNARQKRVYKNIQKRVRRSGLSAKELLFLIFKTYPRWSPGLIWRCFRATPSLLDRKTARLLLSKGVPTQLVMLMWRLSQRRRKAGVRPTRTGRQGTHTGRPVSGKSNRRLALHRRTIHRVAQLSFQSLRNGDIDTWMAIHDPYGNKVKYRKLFWTFRNNILNRRIAIYPVRKLKIQFLRAGRGVIARYYFPMRIGRQPTKLYYWQFRIRDRRWVMF